MTSWCMLDILLLNVFGGFDNIFRVVEAKEEKFNSLHDRSCLISANISDLT